MDFLFAKDLFTNLAILLSASILSNYIYALSLKKPHIKQILIGLTNGIIGILLLINTVRLNNWIVFDTRSILISLSAVFRSDARARRSAHHHRVPHLHGRRGGRSRRLGDHRHNVHRAFMAQARETFRRTQRRGALSLRPDRAHFHATLHVLASH